MYPTLIRYAGPKKANIRFTMLAPFGTATERCTSDRETPTFVTYITRRRGIGVTKTKLLKKDGRFNP
jgi:hypothetical protein